MRVAVGLVALLLAPISAGASTPADGFTESEVVSGLTRPTALAFLPDGRFLVTQLGGQILLVENGSARRLITIPVCSPGDTDLEIGLLGIAIHPDFPSVPRVYLYRTTGTCADVGSRVNQVFCV